MVIATPAVKVLLLDPKLGQARVLGMLGVVGILQVMFQVMLSAKGGLNFCECYKASQLLDVMLKERFAYTVCCLVEILKEY